MREISPAATAAAFWRSERYDRGENPHPPHPPPLCCFCCGGGSSASFFSSGNFAGGSITEKLKSVRSKARVSEKLRLWLWKKWAGIEVFGFQQKRRRADDLIQLTCVYLKQAKTSSFSAAFIVFDLIGLGMRILILTLLKRRSFIERIYF